MRRYFQYIFFSFITYSTYSQQLLNKGDIAIIAVNDLATCINSNLGESKPETLLDELYIVPLVDLPSNYTFTLTDNGYERLNPNLFGNTEGILTLRLKDNIHISKGQIIKIKIVNNSGGLINYKQNLEQLNPNWDFPYIYPQYLNFNITSGDQFFILNGSAFQTNSAAGENHNLNYNDTFLFGFNLKNKWLPLENDTKESKLPGEELQDQSNEPRNLRAYHTTMNVGNNTTTLKNTYTGITTPTSKNEWLIRLMNPNNWGYSDCENFKTLHYNKLEVIEQLYSINQCINTNFTLNIESDHSTNPIQTHYRWFKSLNQDLSSPIPIGTGRNISHSEATDGTYFYFCEITYKLTWHSQATTPSESYNQLNSGYIKAIITQNKISPIQLI